MHRRNVLVLLAALGLSASAGCDASFWPSKYAAKKVEPYAAVKNGMNEKEVVKLLGDPNSRRVLNLEGTGPRATQLTFVGNGHIVTVTLVKDHVIAKERV